MGGLCAAQDALQTLWHAAFPGHPWEGLQAERWVDMGWQRNDPSSDFRGAGLIALQNHLFMAQVRFAHLMPCGLRRLSWPLHHSESNIPGYEPAWVRQHSAVCDANDVRNAAIMQLTAYAEQKHGIP